MGLLAMIRRGLRQCVPLTRAASIRAIAELERRLRIDGTRDELERRVDGLLEEIDRMSEQLPEVYRSGYEDGLAESSDAETVSAAMELIDENERKCDEIIAERDRLKERLSVEHRNGELLQGALDEARRYERTDVMANLEAFPKTVADVLRLAQDLWPNRIAVLDSALRTKLDGQFYVDESWSILRNIATVLWDLRWGEDILPSKVAREFERRTGHEFSPREGNDIMRFTRARAERTFMWDGRPTEFVAHVKGHNMSRKGSLRCHIYLDDERKLIAIGYIGPHLYIGYTKGH